MLNTVQNGVDTAKYATSTPAPTADCSDGAHHRAPSANTVPITTAAPIPAA